MTKPLELTVYPTFWLSGMLWTTEAPGATITDPIDVDLSATAKHFLDAEYHAWIAHMNKMQWTEEVLMRQDEPEWPEEVWDRLGERASILYRLLLAPHASENGYE